jgi:hypothetical protein
MAFRCLRGRVFPCFILIAACSSDDGEPPASSGGSGGAGSAGAAGSPSGDAASIPYAPCSAETSVGGFELVLDPEYTSLEGKVFDAIDPRLVEAEIATEGTCRLVTPPSLLCDPGCSPSTEVCAPGNQCVPVPAGRSVGTVTVSGLATPVEMNPNGATANYRATGLTHPGFAPGADVRLSAAGGDYSAFELRGWGIGLLEVTSEITVTEGQPTVIQWTPPASPSPAHVVVSLDVNNHGSTEASIQCDFEDTGQGEIPASLIDALIAQGTSGFPSVTLTRRTASSASIEPGCVQLDVMSTLDLDVNLTGLTSCDTDAECPEGLTCKPIERFCE